MDSHGVCYIREEFMDMFTLGGTGYFSPVLSILGWPGRTMSRKIKEKI